VLGANATAVRTNAAGDAVVGVDLSTLDGSALRLEADRYVVALGGIESPRLLLASRDTQPAGVGNSSGLVGRYFSDHPEVRGLPLLPMPGGSAWDLVELEDTGPDGAVGVATQLSVTADTQRRAGLPGIHVRTETFPNPFPDGPVPEGVAALLNPLEPAPEAIVTLAVGFGVTPNPDSAVTLLDETNELGDPLASVDWRLHPDDQQRIDNVLRALARVAAMSGAGRLGIDPPGGSWVDVVTGGHHHMGTLRMASDPTAGVVDANGRFHDVSNLYAAGSSVFPTYGHANPTFTVVALSLRLADHLARQVAP
jgi:choline dehydrogenase-like flavoprotein